VLSRRYSRGYRQFITSDLFTGPKPRAPGLRGALTSLSLALFELVLVVVGRLLFRLPACPGAPLAPAEASAQAALPCVLLSHGLGGTRTAYASYACALASSGRCVAALEHGDGTACLARVPPPAGEPRHRGAWLLYAGCGSGAARWAKVARRCAELTLVLDLLCALAEPAAPLPHAPRVMWPLPLARGGPSLAFLEQFRGRVDTDALVAAGHSFGGASAICLARRDCRVSAVVAHDPWLHACAPENTAATPWRRPVALLTVLSDDWSVSKLHDDAALARVRDAVRSAGGVAALAGQRGTNHFAMTDVVFVIPHAITRRLRPGFKKVAPPEPGPIATATHALLDAFLRRHTGANRVKDDQARARAERFTAAMAVKGATEAEAERAWRDEPHEDGHAEMIAEAFGDRSLGLMELS